MKQLKELFFMNKWIEMKMQLEVMKTTEIVAFHEQMDRNAPIENQNSIDVQA